MAKASRLEPFREEILLLRQEGHPPGEIRRQLEEKHGLSVPDSTWYDFMQKSPAGETPGCEDVQPTPATVAPTPKERELAHITTVLKGIQDEALNVMKGTIEGLEELKQEYDDRHKAMQEKLDVILGHLMTRNVPPSVLRRIWRRALIVTGMAWCAVAGVLAWLGVVDAGVRLGVPAWIPQTLQAVLTLR
jgi:hypothetical protein